MNIDIETKDYWFALKSSVYVEFKENKILLYDTKSGNRIETKWEDAIALVSQLYEPKNLGVTLLSKEMLLKTDTSGFVREVLEKRMGDIVDVAKVPNKPVRLIPILSFQKDVERLKKNKENHSLIGNDAKNYLIELNIYLNNSCSLNCLHCDKYYKQIHCCTTKNENQELAFEELESIFRQISFSSVSRVNLLGGNIFEYSYLAQSYKLFDSYKDILHCRFHYENYKPGILPNSLKLDMIVNFPVKETIFKNTWKLVDDRETVVHFIIENEEQYEQMSVLIDEYDIEKYQIHPVYTGENLEFFEENVFVDQEDIFSKTRSIREIFRNQKLNANFFGSLSILPDGGVKANVNAPTLGNIKTDSLMSLIFKEMMDNTAWRVVRDSQPCSECIYQFICSAPSNYEIAIGKPNLCHIHS